MSTERAQSDDEAIANVVEAMLAEARVEVSNADHKASMVLAALGIGFGAVIGGLLAGDWRPSDQGGGEFLWWVGASLAIGSVGFAALAVWPRNSSAKDEGIYYWGQIARLGSFDELCRRLDEDTTPPGHRTRHQLWQLSRIVARKYLLVQWAFALAGLAVVAFIWSAVLA